MINSRTDVNFKQIKVARDSLTPNKRVVLEFAIGLEVRNIVLL